MNKASKELLDKTEEVHWGDILPMFKGIYIIQQRRLHDSGYRLMYVIAHTDFDEKTHDFKYYLLSSCSDVVDFLPLFQKYIIKNYDMCDLHLDIDKNGIIHIWTNSNKKLLCQHFNVSSCSFEIIGGINEYKNN